MKKISISIVRSVCLASLMLFQACLDVESTSHVNTDGSILRTITFDDDSVSIYRGDFPIPIDSTWQRTIQKVEEKKFRLTASKLFHNVDEMNNALKGTPGKTYQYRFELERSFQWFFTKFTYRETNVSFSQINKIPITVYVTPHEIDLWFRKEAEKKPLSKADDKNLDDVLPRFEEWDARNKFEAFFPEFLDGVKTLNNPTLSPSFVEQHKDTLYKCMVKPLLNDKYDTLFTIAARILKTPLVRKAAAANSQGLAEFKRKLDFASGMTNHNFTTNVIMPGLITSSNAMLLEGNKATWREYKSYVKVLDLTMSVESQIVNWWAVISTGLIVLATLVLLIVSTLKRRNRF